MFNPEEYRERRKNGKRGQGDRINRILNFDEDPGGFNRKQRRVLKFKSIKAMGKKDE
jgi:hypothetical protein